MECKHAAALGLTYLREPASFREMAASDRSEFRALASVSRLLEGTSLEKLIAQLRARGITQKRLAEILGSRKISSAR
jgi:uncharacterized Zn finger protein